MNKFWQSFNFFITHVGRAFYSASKGFVDDDCYSKASALSYYTLLSIVPVLAVAFGIAKGFGFEHGLEQQILATFSQQKELAIKVINFARSTLEQAHGSLIAGIGVLALFWTSMGLLGNLERALNTIWKIPSTRSIERRVVDYLPILIFLPILIVASSSFTYLIISKIVELTVYGGFYQEVKPLIYISYYTILLLLSWLLFSFIYIYIPNRKVSWGSCIVAGLIAGTSFQITQWAYINFQILVTSYNAIYGSFAAIPLFLVWLQVSWLIVLAGAEVAYHHATYLKKSAYNPEKPVLASERELILMIMATCARGFTERKPLRGAQEIAEKLRIDPDLAAHLVNKCINAHLIAETESNKLFLAVDPESTTVAEIFKLVDTCFEKKHLAAADPQLEKVQALLAILDDSIYKLSDNPTLKTVLIPR